MKNFISENRDELIRRCKVKVAVRHAREATFGQLEQGIPLFIDQLTKNIAAEAGDGFSSLGLLGPSRDATPSLKAPRLSAAAHGRHLLDLDFSAGQIVVFYGELRQAITQLAVERNAPFSTDFSQLNRCLDQAAADAVGEFSSQRDARVSHQQLQDENQRLSFVVHEINSCIQIMRFAYAAIESGGITTSGATASLLQRSLVSLEGLLQHAVAVSGEHPQQKPSRHLPAQGSPPSAGFLPSDDMLKLIGSCVAGLNDVVLITEAEPLSEPGPRIVFVNDAFERQTGYAREEVIGKSPRFLQGPLTDQTELRRIGSSFRAWQPVRVDLVNYTKLGEAFNVEMDIVPIADDSGWFTHWVSIQRDVTERKAGEQESATRALQRNESIGTLSAGIAHDFNNIIAAVLGNVVLGRKAIAGGNNGLFALNQIDLAAVQARSLVMQILAYTRRQPKLFVRQPLAPLLAAGAQLLRSTLPASVAFNVTLTDEPAEVLADASQISQVMLNLGTNAWHAFKGRPGRIDLTMTVVTSQVGRGQTAHRAEIEIRDNGSGMEGATLARVFEPYFTTKPIGQGTGLGLSVVWGIVKAHGATITVESIAGIGTSIKLVFPVLDADASTIAVVPTQSAGTKRITAGLNRRVLVVDDDEVVLLMLEGILKSHGFDVAAFSDPFLAIAAVRAQPLHFDLVVTDLNMPGASGLQLAREIVMVRADLPIVLGSGYVDDELSDDAAAAGIAGVYRKEVVADELPALLCDVLAVHSWEHPLGKTEGLG